MATQALPAVEAAGVQPPRRLSGLVGRERELALLGAALARPPAVVLVEGEAGIGKTRLVTELRARPEVEACRFVVGSCYRIHEPFPLGPVIEAVRGLGAELVPAGLSPVAGALRPLLPELAQLLPPAPEPLDDRVAERHRVFRGLVEVFSSLGPAVLVLEDMHWADEQSLDFVSYLLSDPPVKLSLVVTFRGEEVDPRVRALTAKPSLPAHRTHVALAPLDAAETAALAAAILGVERVSAEFAAYLCERASGLPFAVEELLALLLARGALVRRGHGWVRKALDELDVPSGIRDPVLERMSCLPADARSVVEAAAVLQTPAPVAAVTATARVPAPRALRGLEDALESRLLTEQDGTVGFRHVLAAQAVYESIPGPRRQDLHGRAAQALASVTPVPLGQVAHHLRQAGRLDEWVDAAEKAADRAVELRHDAEAARLLEDLLRHAPLDVNQRGRIAVRLGEAAVEAGRSSQVLDLLSEVVEHDLTAPVRGEVRFWLAMLLHNSSKDFTRQHQLFTDAVDDPGHRLDLKAWAMISLAVPMYPDVPLAENLEWLHRSLQALPELDDQVFEVFLLGKAAMVLVVIGDPEWRHLIDRIVGLVGETPAHHHAVNAYRSVGVLACHAGHHTMSGQLLEAGARGDTTCRSRRLRLGLQASLAALDYCRGSWDGLSAKVEVLLDQLTDYPLARTDAEAVAACLALARGQLDIAWEHLDTVMRRAQTGGTAVDLLPLSTTALVRLALARGDVEYATESADRLLAVMEPKGMWPLAVRALPTLTQAMMTVGKKAEAGALITRFDRELRDLDAPLAPAALRHARGFLHTGAKRWREAADHFQAAAKLYEPLLCPYEAAQAHEQAALSLFRAGDVNAEQPLRAAMATYGRLGASWDLDRARNVARQHAVSLPARHRGGQRGYGLDLSPRERQVAELAASGRTNKEIGRELFLSTKTVDKHVSAAMRKLGLHSRSALAHHVRAHGLGGDSKNGESYP